MEEVCSKHIAYKFTQLSICGKRSPGQGDEDEQGAWGVDVNGDVQDAPVHQHPYPHCGELVLVEGHRLLLLGQVRVLKFVLEHIRFPCRVGLHIDLVKVTVP